MDAPGLDSAAVCALALRRTAGNASSRGALGLGYGGKADHRRIHGAAWAWGVRHRGGYGDYPGPDHVAGLCAACTLHRIFARFWRDVSRLGQAHLPRLALLIYRGGQ